MTGEERRGHPARTALVATGVAMAGAAAAVVAGRAAVRRARSRPDPEHGEPLAERPGTETRVRSFDGTELAVNIVSPGPAGSNESDTSAPTLVFGHGFSLDMTGWHYQWKHFARTYRCVLFDQRGHGRSDPAADGDYSLDAVGHDLKAVLEGAVPEGPAVLIGHSMGGMGILSFAAHHPEEFGDRVRAVVLADTATADVVKEVFGGLAARVGTFLVPAPRRLATRPERIHRLRAGALSRSSDLAFLATRITNFGPRASPTLVDHVARVAATTPAEVWTNLLGSLAALDLAHALEHLQVPTLVVVGDVDRLTPPATARSIARALPDARLVVLRGAGHCAMLEHHQQFNAAIEGFLDSLFCASRPADLGAPARA